MDYFLGYDQTIEKRDIRSNRLLESLVGKYKNLLFKNPNPSSDFQICKGDEDQNINKVLQFQLPSAHSFIKFHSKGTQ